jgi:ferredoxin
LTPAHALAVLPGFEHHFRIVPVSELEAEQMEFSEYLKQCAHRPPSAIPFLWVMDASGVPQRAMLTRELANLSLDRSRAWKMLEHLAGVKGPVPEAGEALSNESQQEARREGAQEAVYRIVAMLTGETPAPPAVPTRPSAPVPQKEEPSRKPAAAEAQEPREDPYIDSYLCTSCNDCVKINSRMFQYDANKQAYIAESRAGTFAELVKAAEGCPARCIHPGTSRPGDSTATPAMRARAAKFR